MPENDPIQELRQLQRWYASGLLNDQEFAAMYRDLDKTNAKALCDNGDSRIAIISQEGKNLCGICALRVRHV